MPKPLTVSTQSDMLGFRHVAEDGNPLCGKDIRIFPPAARETAGSFLRAYGRCNQCCAVLNRRSPDAAWDE